jgi:hypothetical protein
VKRTDYLRIRDRYLKLIERGDKHPGKTLAEEFDTSAVAMRLRLYRMRKVMGLFDRRLVCEPGAIAIIGSRHSKRRCGRDSAAVLPIGYQPVCRTLRDYAGCRPLV